MRRAIAGIGRTLVTLGLLILLFVVYQLWGTGIFTARAQENLKSKFQKELQQAGTDNPVVASPTTTKPGVSTPPTVPHDNVKPAPPTPAEGEVEGKISIQRIGLDMAFVEGTSRDDLKKGPGHYPGTPLPGTIGNAAIAGHRTTYLHPFGDLDKMLVGDQIVVQTLAGTFVYQVSTPWFKVKSTDVWVVANTADPELTLTACHPKGSAEFRIVIKAKLIWNKSSRVSIAKPLDLGTGKGRATQQQGLAESLSGQARSFGPSIFWGVIAAIVGLAWWWGFRRWRHPRTWLIGALPFLIALFPFYVYLERALPSGY
ncbi:MAG TPA: sortase [Acidimicrobiia bacterium]|nr:sortase [Acidimicrobiia bacterium]